MSDPRSLAVLMGGLRLGTIVREAGRLTLSYDEAWLARGDRAIPLSLSMPLAAREHRGDVVAHFLWNLLPDSVPVVEAWARRFGVSARNPFAILSHTGEDCPGAVQLVREGRVDEVREGGGIEWVDEADVARRLADLRADAGASGRRSGDAGRFSLAGAQPKTALALADGRWGVPYGRSPTTHILKPPIPGLDGQATNEHLCLDVARSYGLPAASTRVMRFGDEVAIVVERFDRVRRDGAVRRVHQEDLCQALGVAPWLKYEAEGGPGIRSIVNGVLRWSSSPVEARRSFLAAVAYNQVVGGPDAHAKNYSIQHGAGGGVRLAPLYDVASFLPYEASMRKVKMAMRVGGKYRFDDVLPRHWEEEARACGARPEEALGPLRDMVARLPDLFSDAAARARAEGLDGRILDALPDAVARRCAWLRTRYGGEEAPPPPAPPAP